MDYGKSFVAYNLDTCLDSLKIISDRHDGLLWFYASHKGEGGDKDHFHLYLLSHCSFESNKKRIFEQFVALCGNAISRGSIQPIRNIGTAYGYAFHFKPLLYSLGVTRQYYYSEDDVILSDEQDRDYYREQLHDYLTSTNYTSHIICDCFERGMTASQAARLACRQNIQHYNAIKSYACDMAYDRDNLPTNLLSLEGDYAQ